MIFQALHNNYKIKIQYKWLSNKNKNKIIFLMFFLKKNKLINI